YRKGLKLDPGWRRAWVARLNLLAAKLKPPTSARRAPSSGSSETSADCACGTWASSKRGGAGGAAPASASLAGSASTSRTRTRSPRDSSADGLRRVHLLLAASRVTV